MNRDYYRILFLSIVLIISIGLCILYSASYQNVRVPQKIFYDQLVFALVGVVVLYLVSRINYQNYFDIAYVFYGLSVVLLIFVLLGGRDALGARRWVEFGIINFQPSEVSKLTLIFMLSRYYAKRRPSLSFSILNRTQVLFQDLIVPFVLSAISMLLIFKQPDLGTAILLFGIFFVMAFVSGISYKLILSFLGLCAMCVPFAWNLLKSYQKDRLLVFLNPNIDPLGAGYTIIQSKIAVGSGQLWGKGFLSGTQNQLNFLPERHTDFIFSVMGEEWGFLGAVVLLLCYFVLIYFGFKVASKVKDRFAMLLCVGIITIFTLQVVINIGMVMGLFPIVGLTLPLVSYGRSSFFIFLLLLGILLNITRQRSIF